MHGVLVKIVAAGLILQLSASQAPRPAASRPDSAPEDPWMEAMRESESLLQRHEYISAVAAARRALEIAERNYGPTHPRTVKSLGKLAVCHKKWRNPDGLARIMRKLSAIDPGSYATARELGRIFMLQGKRRRAERMLRKALALKPDEREPYGDLGAVYLDLKQPAAALKAFRRALEAEPKSYWLHVQVARALHLLGDYQQAGREYAWAKKNTSKSSRRYIMLGYAYLDEGDTAEAADAFGEMLGEDGSDFQGHHHLAMVSMRKGDYAQAEKHLKEAVRIMDERPDTSPWHLAHSLAQLGRLYSMQRRHADEERIWKRLFSLREVLAFHFHITLSMRKLAELYKAQGRAADEESLYRKALDSLRRISEPFPSLHASIRTNLADSLARQGKRAEAESLINTIREDLGRMPDLGSEKRAGLLRTAAKTCGRLGLYAEAERLLGEAKALSPGQASPAAKPAGW